MCVNVCMCVHVCVCVCMCVCMCVHVKVVMYNDIINQRYCSLCTHTYTHTHTHTHISSNDVMTTRSWQKTFFLTSFCQQLNLQQNITQSFVDKLP